MGIFKPLCIYVTVIGAQCDVMLCYRVNATSQHYADHTPPPPGVKDLPQGTINPIYH